jgi:hypothetical protein
VAESSPVRGRPATLKKAEFELEDGQMATLKLVGDGKTVQVILPAQWNLSAMQRSITSKGGRTMLAFVSESPTP